MTFSLDTHDQTTRELAHRSGDGLDVTLVWYPSRNDVAVRISDVRSGENFELRVEPAAALDAFEHPFAYASAPARQAAAANRSLAAA